MAEEVQTRGGEPAGAAGEPPAGAHDGGGLGLGVAGAGRILALLFAANLLNFFDRAMPGILIEEVREDFPLSDTQIGVVAAAFTLVLAVAGVPIGRLADRGARRRILGAGLAVWSLMTAASGAVSSYLGLVLTRVGVGIGEASYAPAANSLIADLYPAARRSRAVATFMLGLPLGLVAAYFTVGAIAEAFDSWRAPFFLAAIPGLVLAVALWRIDEPARGASEARVPLAAPAVDRPIRQVMAIPTLWCLTFAFVGYNFASYTTGTFTVPLLQRHFDLSLTAAATTTGFVVGVTGLVGLVGGGRVAERAARRSIRHRVLLGAVCLGLAAPLTLLALGAGPDATAMFALDFGLGWLLGYLFFTCCYPAISDVVEPRLRATAIAVVIAAGYLLGGAGGPLAVGLLSDGFAEQAMAAAGATRLTDAFRGEGLREAMQLVVPISLAVAAVAMLLASRTVTRDNERMVRRAYHPGP